jgi:hypothetical protein
VVSTLAPSSSSAGGSVGVRFNEPFPGGHACGGLCEYGFGYFVR